MSPGRRFLRFSERFVALKSKMLFHDMGKKQHRPQSATSMARETTHGREITHPILLSICEYIRPGEGQANVQCVVVPLQADTSGRIYLGITKT